MEENKPKDAVDVTSNFRIGFLMLVVCTFVQAVGLHLNHFIIDKENTENVRIVLLYCLAAPAVIFGILCWCYLFMSRFSHEGEVCSGDYLERGA